MYELAFDSTDAEKASGMFLAKRGDYVTLAPHEISLADSATTFFPGLWNQAERIILTEAHSHLMRSHPYMRDIPISVLYRQARWEQWGWTGRPGASLTDDLHFWYKEAAYQHAKQNKAVLDKGRERPSPIKNLMSGFVKRLHDRYVLD
jgi:hypothetical protein